MTAPASQLPTQHNGLGIAYRVMAMACMACLSAIVKWTGERGTPVFEIIFFRNAFAFVPLGLYIWRTTGFSVLKTRRPLGHLTRSTIGLMGMICGFSAVQYLPLTEATAFNFASPLFMTALSALVLGEVVGKHRWGAVLVGFIGVLIMVRPEPGHLNVVGVSLAIGSALGAAGAMVAIRQIAATEKGATIVFYFTLAGTVLGIEVPRATAIVDAAAARRDYLDETGGRYVHVIAAGGIETSGDVAKSLACGADAVMLGEPLSVAAEAPGKGAWWHPSASHPKLPRGRFADSAPDWPRAALAEVIRGASSSPDGDLNIFGGLRRSIAKAGYSDLKEFQRVELVVRS
mgnify:CR=1 FL=1